MILDLVKEKNVWDILKESDKPCVMYGMGNGADKILEVCERKGIEVLDFFASDDFVRGHSFHGKEVLTYAKVKEKYRSFNVIMSFASRRKEVIENVLKINSENPVFSPDVPVCGTGLFTREFVKLHETEFDEVYNMFCDERSKEVFVNVLNFKVSGKIKYLFPFDEKREVYTDILKLGKNEVIVDLGAYDGDTIREMTETAPEYKHIYAAEPDKKNFKKLTKNTAQMNDITLFNIGAWKCEDTVVFGSKSGRNSAVSTQGIPTKMNSVDNLIKDNVTLIKMDIEGSELKAIEGAKNTITTHRPKLYICAYHRNEDMFAIPLKIKEFIPDYKLYFRHHDYIPAWESNFYFT